MAMKVRSGEMYFSLSMVRICRGIAIGYEETGVRAPKRAISRERERERERERVRVLRDQGKRE